MSRFAIRTPHFIVVACLIVAIMGTVSALRMPVDMFPAINIPVVVVATFYSGMPPEQIEADITSRLERFFTLASGIEHIESRSLPGVSLIKVYFQPGMNPDAAVTTIANLAMAELSRLPPGTLPPFVLKFDASSLPVCLVTLQGRGSERNAAARSSRSTSCAINWRRAGRRVPQPFGGRQRQIMVYVDPLKLEAHQLSLMDVVRAVNDSNLILPAGNAQIGRLRLQHLHEQPDRDGRRHQPDAAEDRRGCRRCASATSARRRTPPRSSTTSCAWTASGPCTCRC